MGFAGNERRRFVAVVIGALATVVMGALLVGCANDEASGDNTSAATKKSSATSTTAARSTTTDVTGAGAATGNAADWKKVMATPDCQCSDGSPYFFWTHRGTSDRLVVFLEGGGACFSADTCGPTNPSYNRTLEGNDLSGPNSSGIFDLANTKNPFRHDSFVFIPYCTGDLHMGDAIHDYGGGVVIHHNGAVNAGTAMTTASALFEGAKEVVVSGSSAGSAPTPLYAGVAQDLFPDAKVTAIADASGAYPGTEAITTATSALWGTDNVHPKWKETASLPATAWTLPGLFSIAAAHAPKVTMANINTAYDDVQQRFVTLAGFPDTGLPAMIDANNAAAEAGGAKLHSWVGPGTLHTILGRPELYSVDVGGTKLIDWITELVGGKDVPDVHCTDCGSPSS